MTKGFNVKLVLAVYKVTELFPEEAALKHEIRSSANEILADLTKNNFISTSKKIKNIKGLFDLAEAENWVDPRNFLVLRREYDKIEELTNTGKPVDKSFFKSTQLRKKTKERQKRILELIKENTKVKLIDLTRSFPALSRRTLLRNLDTLSQSGLVVKDGNGRGVCYTVKNATLSKVSNS